MKNSSILTQHQHEVEAEEGGQELEAIIREAHRRARRRRLKLTLAGLGIAAVAAVAFFLLVGDGPGGGEGGAADPAAEASPGPVGYTRMKTLTLMTTGGPQTGPYSLRGPLVTDVWVGEDGSGRVYRRFLPSEWPGPRDRRRAQAAGDRRSLAQVQGRRLPEPTDEELSASALDEAVGAPGYPAPAALPSEPGALRRMLLGSDANNGTLPPDQALFELVAGVVLRPSVDPSVHAAAFVLARQIPTVDVDREARDPRGRRTTALSFSPSRRPPMVETIYFDANTKQALAYDERFDRPTKTLDSRLLSSTVLSRVKTVESIPPPTP